MEFNKLKLKTKDVQLFNIDALICEQVAEAFDEVEKSNNILISIIKENQFGAINEYIENLDFNTDFVMWIMYPKGTSKRFKGVVEVNRDDIRTKINSKVKTVSMVSLDGDWSAMRLRNCKYSK